MSDSKYLIIKNISHEGPGLLEQVLKREKIDFEVHDLVKTQSLPSLKHASAVIMLGGPDSANDFSEKIRIGDEILKFVLKHNIPFLGICLGMQMLAKAGGAKIVRSPQKEIGFRNDRGSFFEIDLTEEGQKDPLFSDLETPLSTFQLHGETILPSPQTQILGTSDGCKHQIIKVGPVAYGLQCHFELTEAMLEDWRVKDPDLRKIDKQQLCDDFKMIKPAFDKTSERLMLNFIRLADQATFV